jgi:adenylate kinase family enzyme
MKVSGGIRFLPIYGRSGSGKTSAARELGTHLPEAAVVDLERDAIMSREALLERLRSAQTRRPRPDLLIAVVDQYEEAVAERTAIPTQFVEQLSLLDREELRSQPTLFVWLTTSQAFQRSLADATSRNARILVSRDYELHGPAADDWPGIIEETFDFHNESSTLADFEILTGDLEEISIEADTLGRSIELVGDRLASGVGVLQDVSQYQVTMLWPVTDGTRIQRVAGFTDAREGYRLDWNAFYRQLNTADRAQLPLQAYNRARLYFDVRLVPINAADLYPLAQDLGDETTPLRRSYLDRFAATHFFSVISGSWNPEAYSPMRERESERARRASEWYPTVTRRPVLLSTRIARCLRELGLDALPEREITTRHGTVRADILIDGGRATRYTIVELKAFAASGTMPSTIKEQLRGTLRKYAQLGGFLPRQ